MTGEMDVPALSGHAYEEAHRHCIEALKQAPDTAAAYFLLGVIAADHHNHAKACELYDRATGFGPTDGRFPAWKGRSLIALNRREEAVAAARAAAALSGNGALTLDTIGVVLSRAGLHEEALDFYAGAATALPGNANLQYNHGAALQFLGRLEDARAAYERCLAIDPGETRALSALAGLSRQTAQDNRIDELEAVFREAIALVEQGHVVVVDVRTEPGYTPAMVTSLARHAGDET